MSEKRNENDTSGLPPMEDSRYSKHYSMLDAGLEAGAVKNAMIRDGQDPDLDDPGAQQVKRKEPIKSGGGNEKKKRVIDGKRSMNGGLVLSRVGIEYNKLADMVNKMAPGDLNAKQLEALKEFLPTDEEIASLEEYLAKAAALPEEEKAAAMEQMTECEKYMVVMMRYVKDPRAKIDGILGQFQRIELPPGTTVDYFTDIEGNWEYFLELVQGSKVLEMGKDNRLTLQPNCIFVHGGDSPDKGPGDIRVVKALVQLKLDYPDRVFLILGNRDINKVRFMPELAEGKTGKDADIYWDPNHKPYQTYIEEKGLEDGHIATLKWMLECTMGCPETFETRRMELAILQGIEDTSKISDEDVLHSFRESVNPNGSDPWMLEYLRYSQLMLLIGDCAFVHGGIDEECLGHVPGRQGGSRLESMEEWCEALNKFTRDMVAEFERQPEYDETGKFGGELLKDYGVPNARAGPTIVYNNLVENGNPVAPDEKTRDYLAQAGIKRLFIGHQPVGECPSVVSVDGLLVFMCDTSYSDIKADKSANPLNNRGIAFTNVVITSTSTTVTGRLSNGDEHGFLLEVSSSVPAALVGQQLQDGSWVKTVVDGKPLIAKGEGFRVITRSMEVNDVLSQLSNAADDGSIHL